MPNLKINNAVFIFFIAFVICIQNIWGPDIYILDEAKNATCARELMESNDHIVPTFNGQLRTDKPPLHYYFMMVSYKIFGVNEFGSRFFSALFGALTVLITYLFARKLLNRSVAFIAALALVSSLHFALQFHLAVPDPFLVFFTTLAGFAFIDGYINQDRRFTYLAYASIGFGILAKGPIAIALPGFAVLLFILLSRNFNLKTIFGFRPVSGLMLSFLIALPWYILVGLKTDGAWIKGFLFDHNINRFSDPQEGHGGTFFTTWIFVLVGMLPGSVFIIQCYRNWWKERGNTFLFFCGIFASVVIVFFSLADTRLPNYTVPAYPFLAILFGAYLNKSLNGEKSIKWFKFSLIVLFIIYLIIPFSIYFGLGADTRFMHLQSLSVYFSIMGLFALAGFYQLWKGKKSKALGIAATGFIVFSSLLLNVAYPKVNQLNPVHAFLEEADTTRPMIYFQRMNPAIVFHLKRVVDHAETIDQVKSMMEADPDAYLITRSDYADEIRSNFNFREVFNERELFEPKEIVVFERQSFIPKH